MEVFVDVIFDVILIAILAVGALVGYKVGFIKTVCKPFKGLLALVLAFFTASPIGNAIVKPLIQAPLVNQLSAFLTEKCGDLTVENAYEQLPTLIKMALGICGIDINGVIEGAEGGTIAENIVTAVSDPFVSIVSTIIAFIVLWFVFKLLMGLIISIVNGILDRGIIGLANRILGCVMMFVLAFFACWAISAIFETVIHLPVFVESGWTENFSGGFIYRFFKMINPIELLLSF